MIAARMDAGDESFIEMIKDMILSDNNTAILTVEVIRGIVESTNSQLHKLLADFLVAARLQEGVRQAICENADCGSVALGFQGSAFLLSAQRTPVILQHGPYLE